MDTNGDDDDSQPIGRLAVPYVLLAYMPSTCNSEQRMLYAGAREVMRTQAETSKVLEVTDAEEVEEVAKMLETGE